MSIYEWALESAQRKAKNSKRMCAINGFNFNDRELALRMNTVTRHRGPDGAGIFCDEGISLGHNRLAIIDTSPLGHQPMATPDGRFTITYNGELYNFPELKRELEARGHTFKSKSDTEVLLRLFSLEGPACVKRLIGIFAFAVWDRDTETLTLARDHVGVKPLYYFFDGGRFIFSSEIKAILEHRIPRELDGDALNLYFRFLYVVGAKTAFKGIYKLQPGHFAVLKNRTFSIHRYWSPPPPMSDDISYEEAQGLVRAHLREAVRSELISDRPVGLYLSGGIDSSVALALMSQEATGTIKTFTTGFAVDKDREKFNVDFELARASAQFFSTDHHEVVVTARDVADNFERAVYHMDEPVSNHIQTATLMLSQEASKEVAVVLGGDGGDELFGGYDRYWYAQLVDRIRARPPLLWQSPPARALLRLWSGGRRLDVKLAIDDPLARFLAFMAQKEAVVNEFLLPDVSDPTVALRAYAPYFESPRDEFASQMMWTDLQTWLPDESLVRSDKLAMAHGLEQRVPILDPRVIDLAFRLPLRYKLKSRTHGKRILRDAFRTVLPKEILRERKRGWFSPASWWLRGPLKEFAYEILSPSYTEGTRALFDFDAIRRMLDDHIHIRRYALNQIWALMTFQVWYRKFLSK